MASDFFNGTGLGWGGSLCAMVNYSRRCAFGVCVCVCVLLSVCSMCVLSEQICVRV